MYTLITGASAGIGKELARVFAREKHSLILVARSVDKLQELKSEIEKESGVKVQIIVKDLSQPGAAFSLYENTVQQGWEVDVLVNNAGIGLYGFFADTDWRQEFEMLELNVVALTELSKLFLKPMRQKKRGYILNVASTAAFQPGPMMAVYYASKAYVLSFSEALANELNGTGVSVSVLCPGPTESGFKSRAQMDNHNYLFTPSLMMTAEAVAKEAYAGLMKQKRVIIPGFINKISPLGMRFFPRRLVTAIVRLLQESRKNK